MPFIGLFLLLIAIGLALHAYKTGRPQVWLYILIFLPLAGSIAYACLELLPEFARSRRARQVAANLRTVVDPDRDWRHLGDQARETDSVDAKCKFAEECERKGMWTDAIALYEQAALGVFADDPMVLRGLARAQFGSGDGEAAMATLDRLRAAHPDYQNQDAHLTYARALEILGRKREAEIEYRALIGYYAGMEARARYALLLRELGDPAAAQRLFEEIIRASKACGIALGPQDREWVRAAEKYARGV
jgi:hypothetical protein